MSTLKIIHFADFHLGVESYGPVDPETKLSGRILDFLDSLDATIDYAYDNDADLVIFAGDAFHKHSPEPTLLREFGERVVRLSEQCPVVLLVGNHDMPGTVEKASAVDVFSTLRVPNVIIGSGYRIYDITTKNGDIQVATVPYPLKNQFLNFEEKKNIGSDLIIKRKLTKVIHTLAKEIDPNIPAILLGHFTVEAAKYGSEESMNFGMVGIDVNDLVSGWDYVALGHLHYHQDLSTLVKNDKHVPPIVYAGSLDRVSFSEEHDRKGFVWVEIDESKKVHWEFVEVDARPFVTVTVDTSKAKNQTQAIISKIHKIDLRDAIVRLQVTTVEGRSKTINRKLISKALEEAEVYYTYEISIKEEIAKRTRLDEDMNIMQMSHEEALKTYFQMIGKSGKELKELMKVGLEIIEEVNEQSL